MLQEQTNREDQKLDTERRVNCKGSALVKLEYLKWNEYINRNPEKRQPDEKHVERLERVLARGCRRLHINNHIIAIVSQEQLNDAKRDAKSRGLNPELPSNYATISCQDAYPELRFPGGIECLRGRHRIEAWKRLSLYNPDEKWWIVDLYISNISYELTTILLDAYPNNEKPCDGEVYRNIRLYQSLPRDVDRRISPATCVGFEMLWWAKFHKTREQKLRALFAKPKLNRMLAAGFDALSVIPGLFDAGMMVTTLNKVMATRFHEQILHYIKHIETVWGGIFRGVEGGLRRVDKATVKKMELRAPGMSTWDAQELYGPISHGKIFSGFSTQERRIIWDNIMTFKGIIPSLHTFFKDVHLLQACANGIKWLIDVSPDETLFFALGKAYSQRASQIIQTSETTFRLERGSPKHLRRVSSLELVAFALRENKNLPKKAPAKHMLKEMPRAKPDNEVLQKFASVAKRLGFNTPEIEKIMPTRPEDPDLTPIARPFISAITTGPGADLKHRCGLPCARTFKEDAKYLYLDEIYRDSVESGEGITSFFVLQNWFTAFFGPWHIDSWSINMDDEDTAMTENQEVDINLYESTAQEVDMQEPATQHKEHSGADGTIQDDDTPFVSTPRADEVEISFVEWNNLGNIHKLTIKQNDPDSQIEKTLRCYKLTAFDINEVYVEPQDCYRVATHPTHNNTLYFKTEQAMLDARKRSPDATLLDVKENNATMAQNFDQGNTKIFLMRVENPESISSEWKWRAAEDLDVPLNDPHDIVGRKMQQLWLEYNLKPHDSSLRALEDADCYKVAFNSPEHSLYLMDLTPKQQPPSTPLVFAPADVHRDKVVQKGDSKIGMSFIPERVSIRKNQKPRHKKLSKTQGYKAKTQDDPDGIGDIR